VSWRTVGTGEVNASVDDAGAPANSSRNPLLGRSARDESALIAPPDSRSRNRVPPLLPTPAGVACTGRI